VAQIEMKRVGMKQMETKRLAMKLMELRLMKRPWCSTERCRWDRWQRARPTSFEDRSGSCSPRFDSSGTDTSWTIHPAVRPKLVR
jgi:hypothetical protein